MPEALLHSIAAEPQLRHRPGATSRSPEVNSLLLPTSAQGSCRGQRGHGVPTRWGKSFGREKSRKPREQTEGFWLNCPFFRAFSK